jgi:hypothetical protein
MLGMTRLIDAKACARRPKASSAAKAKQLRPARTALAETKNRAHRKTATKEAVFTLVECGGQVRTHSVRDVSAKTLRPIITENIKTNTLALGWFETGEMRRTTFWILKCKRMTSSGNTSAERHRVR